MSSTEDESSVFQRSVEISIIIYPRLKRELPAGYLEEFIWGEHARGNHFVAILTEIVRQYQLQNGSFKSQNSSFTNYQIFKRSSNKRYSLNFVLCCVHILYFNIDMRGRIILDMGVEFRPPRLMGETVLNMMLTRDFTGWNEAINSKFLPPPLSQWGEKERKPSDGEGTRAKLDHRLGWTSTGWGFECGRDGYLTRSNQCCPKGRDALSRRWVARAQRLGDRRPSNKWLNTL